MSVGKLNDEFINFLRELKQKNDIVEVIGNYVALDRKGGNYWACCPFHHERTPSFAVNEGEQYYHCFGCQESGDVIKFVQEIESTDFMGAVQILAARAKMTVPENGYDSEEAAKRKKKRDTMVQIMRDTARFYLNNLYSGDARADKYLQYIQNRSLAPTTVKKFGLGASLDYTSLPKFLTTKGYSKEDAIACGVLSADDKGRVFDSLGERLIFPIINAMDEVVGFGGRTLDKTKFAKYKNTKETMLFDKSKTLYNINLLKKLKREQTVKEIIFVEGYMDTITLYQAGFKNVVATMGTSLTKEQARLAKRYTDNILISYDGDFAGQNADLRGLEILKEAGLNVRVVPMPDGLDPDDVAKQGAEEYQKCLDQAMPVIDYRIHALEKKYDIKKTEEKRQFVSEALKVVRSGESADVREELLKYIAKISGTAFHVLERDLNNIKQEVLSVPQEGPKERITEISSEVDKTQKAKRFVLAAKLFSAPYAQSVDLSDFLWKDETHIVVANYIMDHEKSGERLHPSELFVLLENNAEIGAILDFNNGDKLTGPIAEQFFNDSIRTMQSEAIEEEIEQLKATNAQCTEKSEIMELAKKINECVRRRNALKKS
ncbi:MAG: DNA primase [Clostridia bacterium]|nr:DNA primase [Clostridia bacterium]